MAEKLTIGAWRSRLEILSILVSTAILFTTIARYLLAIEEERDFVDAVRFQSAVLEGVTLPIALVVALSLVVLPRIFFRWPAETPNGTATIALFLIGLTGVAILVFFVVALVPPISELPVDQFDRESEATRLGLWWEICQKTGVIIAAIAVVAFAGMARTGLQRERVVVHVEPEMGPPPSASS
ncbi:hypothetical protein [Actinospongicola halichondriae]|uniref:hypothetical protein n=1 Tax=Actinospongicola halichondriae TaxID=3236844 RepID=UPI003D4C90B0